MWIADNLLWLAFALLLAPLVQFDVVSHRSGSHVLFRSEGTIIFGFLWPKNWAVENHVSVDHAPNYFFAQFTARKYRSCGFVDLRWVQQIPVATDKFQIDCARQGD